MRSLCLAIVVASLAASFEARAVPLGFSEGLAPAPSEPVVLEPIPNSSDVHRLQLQIDELRRRRDAVHLAPPLIVMGAAVGLFAISLVVGATLSFSNPESIKAGEIGIYISLVALTAGLVWLIVDLVIRGNLGGQIDDLEAQLSQARAKASAGGGWLGSEGLSFRF